MNILYQRIYNSFSIIAPEQLHNQLAEIEEDKEFITNIIVIVGAHECKKKTHHLKINDQMLLKIEKDNTKPPITDLAFYYLDIHDHKLKLEPELTICTIQEDDSKWHYQNGNLDFTYDLSKVFGYQSNQKTALVMCYKTDQLQDPWRDIILIQKNQTLPEGFYKLPQSIQNSYLAYSLATTYFTKKYKMEISDSYPQNIQQEQIAQFCFPNGISLFRQNQLPKYHHYILTSENGVRTYCTALIFCEQNIKGYHEMAIVLSSHFCYSEQSIELLKNLYQIYISKNHLPLERYICNIVDEIVMPQESSETYIYNGSKQIYFFQPNSFPLSSNQAFQCLFGVLNKKNIVLLYFALLQEKKVQLISSKPVICSLVIEALLVLLYPFEYTHILISSLPENLEQYLGAPIPYLIGVNKQQADKYQDAIQVYLDSNNIKQNQHIEIPEDMYDKFLLKLKEFDQFYNPQLIETIDLAFPLPTGEEQETIDQYQVREVFLRFNMFILSDYKKFIEQQQFKDKNFVKAKQRIKAFLEPFVDTRLFTYFIQQRMELSQNDSQLEYFDDCMKEPKGDHFTLPVQVFKEYLKPNNDGFKEDKHFIYNTFPIKLNDEFFSNPRLEFLKHENVFQANLFPKSQIEILRYELQHIYKLWFRGLVLRIEEGKQDLSDLVKLSLNLIKEMADNYLVIESEIFKNAMIACAHYQLHEYALQFIQKMKQFGYQKYIQIYQYFFLTLKENKSKKSSQHLIQQVTNSSRSLTNKSSRSLHKIEEQEFFIEIKCPRCGRKYTVEEFLGSFIGEFLECKSNGTLGCNNKFNASIFFHETVHKLQKPTKIEISDDVSLMFYFYFLGLPFKFIQYQQEEDFNYVIKKAPIFIDYKNIYYTDENDESKENYLTQAVHEVFGIFLSRMKEIIAKQSVPKEKHHRTISELSD